MHRKNSAFIVLAIIISLSILSSHDTLAESDLPVLTIYYFYRNICSSCDEEGIFIDKFNTCIGLEKNGVKLQFNIYNLFHKGNDIKFKVLCSKYGITADIQNVPIVFIGDTYLIGSNEIDNKLKAEFIKAKAALLIDSLSAVTINSGDPAHQDYLDTGVNKGTDYGDTDTAAATPAFRGTGLHAANGIETTLIYFYVTSCKDCNKVKKVLDSLQRSYDISINEKKISSAVKILKYNIGELDNLELIMKYFETYDIPDKDRKVPIVFIGQTYTTDTAATQVSLEGIIKSGEGLNTIIPDQNSHKPDAEHLTVKGYSAAGIFLTGLINGINPCSLSMLLFFLSLLLVRSVNVFKFGLAFITGKFIAYLALGTLAYKLLLLADNSWLNMFQSVMKVLLLILTMMIVAMNLWDYFAIRSEKYGQIRMQLPQFLRKLNHDWIKRYTSIGNLKLLLLVCFLLGLAISFGEFLCTGQIYLATIIYILKSNPELDLQAFGYFLVYVLAMMIPLFLLTIAIHKGKEVFDLTEAIRSRMYLIKLINAAVFFIFGIIIFLF